MDMISLAGNLKNRSQESEHQTNAESGRPSSSASVTSIPEPLQSPAFHSHCYYNNSLAIRQEIQRFESVHPSIYAIYDLLELVGGADGQLISQRIREHVVCIEDSFVNSQEWTLSRTVPDLRLGVVGTICSGKSALVHRYLTGSYLQDESPEGGRFKKEVIVDGQSYLLLIRDEGGPPEMQLSCWVDAVLFVFSVESESSFNSIYSYYTKMFHLRSNHDIPIFLIGTQDAVSESNPRVIDEFRARKLAMELKHCTYYETCATIGYNVDKVFQDACNRIICSRNVENQSNPSRPTTPNQFGIYRQLINSNNLNNINSCAPSQQPSTPLGNITNSKYRHIKSSPTYPNNNNSSINSNNLNSSNNMTFAAPIDDKMDNNKGNVLEANKTEFVSSTNKMTISSSTSSPLFVNNTPTTASKPTIATKPKISNLPANSLTSKQTTLTIQKRNESIKVSNDAQFKLPAQVIPDKELASKEQTTPVQTPNIVRKNRRKSNLFTPLSSKNKNSEDKYKNGEIGVGRTIPIKQGYLYKKSKKTLNKDWKKKYVTLTTEGCLTYHPTLHDYMDDVHGKNIPLKHTTVKIPGQKPRCGRASTTYSPNILELDGPVNSFETKMIPSTNPKYESSSVKKRSRRLKNIGTKNSDNGDDSDGNEFVIVSLENKQWHFNANNNEEREGWICAIEQQILSSLQNSECEKSKLHNVNNVDDTAINSIRTVPGNKYCADCDAPNPEWASLNSGTLICIECSGIHRNLGTHISKVRSLGLDVWPSSHVNVMLGLGNTAVNKILEHNIIGLSKPTPNSSHEEKERFIRAKYEAKEFIAPLTDKSTPIEHQIIDSVLKMDIKQLAFLLAHASINNVNLNFGNSREKKTPLHLAASRGCLEITQLLLWHNADDKAVDHEGKTALFYARISGHKEIEELLIQSGNSSNNNNGNIYINNKSSQMSVSLSASDSRTPLKRRESIPLNFKTEIFNKLPASII